MSSKYIYLHDNDGVFRNRKLSDQLNQALVLTQLRYAMRVEGFREMNHQKLLEAITKTGIKVIGVRYRVFYTVSVFNWFGQQTLWDFPTN
jgi:hypothetical protein